MHADDDGRKEGATGWERLDRMTDAEVEAAAQSDTESQPLTAQEVESLAPVPEVKQIRLRLGMTQEHVPHARARAQSHRR